MRLLVVVDMQNDFIDGALGSEAAKAIVPNVVKKITDAKNDTLIIFTKDTHFEDYDHTLEGKLLPVKHCIFDCDGWCINKAVRVAWLDKEDTITIMEPEFRENNTIIKTTFGSLNLMNFLLRDGKVFDEIEFIGLLTDICVVSNVLMTRAALPDVKIIVDASCCAGSTPEKHKSALEIMKSCQIEIISEV